MAHSCYYLFLYHCWGGETLVVDLSRSTYYIRSMLTHIVATGLALSVPNTQVGVASWYGKENYKSSTGKRLSHSKPEAAHKTIPIGTKVKVTSLSTMKCTVVTVVDRGPYTKGRILDLNIKAAQQIGISRKGIDRVKLEWSRK